MTFGGIRKSTEYFLIRTCRWYSIPFLFRIVASLSSHFVTVSCPLFLGLERLLDLECKYHGFLLLAVILLHLPNAGATVCALLNASAYLWSFCSQIVVFARIEGKHRGPSESVLLQAPPTPQSAIACRDL